MEFRVKPGGDGTHLFSLTLTEGKTKFCNRIFILEGLFTAVFGLVSFFLMPRTPSKALFLNAADKAIIERALYLDGGGEERQGDRFTWRAVGEAFKSPQVGLLA